MLPIKQYIRSPRLAILGLLSRCSKFISNDKLYLQMRYYLEFGKTLNLKNPKTFNEKLQWLKLYNRKPEYTQMVDKYAVKEYVARRIGKKYIIPTIGVWNTPEEIDFDVLPNQFVLKTTHGGGGGGVVICKDKTTFNKDAAITKINRAMKADIYTSSREWPYKHVPRKVIAEQYLEDESGLELKDYKFFCFNGTPRLCQVISDRRTQEKIDFYDMEWKLIKGLVGLNPVVHNSTYNHPSPQTFETMKQVAASLSKDIPFSRIDLYDISGRCYFGEITFFPAAGFGQFSPDDWNEKIGALLKLPDKSIK